MEDRTQAEMSRKVKNMAEARRQEEKDVWLTLATTHGSCENYGKKKERKSSLHSQMATQSKANVKRTHMTDRAPVKKSTALTTRWVYRWLYVH